MSENTTSAFAGVGTAYLLGDTEELSDDDAFTIHGVALGENDVTVGQSRERKLWDASGFEEAAETLEGKPLVKNHINSTEGTVGEVTHASHKPGVGVVYEAEIASHYEELAQDVQSGIMDVSVRALHPPTEELEKDDEKDAWIIDRFVFDNLSVVNHGASGSNTAEPGPIDDLISDPGAAEASAVMAEDTAVATLQRSSPVDQETVNDVFGDSEEAESEETEDGVDDDVEGDVETEEAEETDEELDESEEAESSESDEAEEAEDLELHIPEWDSVSVDEWEEPELADWGIEEDWDDLSNAQSEIVAEHYLVADGGFPPESFDDLAFPVVDTEGALNREALEQAHEEIADLEDTDPDAQSWIGDMLEMDFSEYLIETEEAEHSESEEVATNQTQSGPVRTASLSTYSTMIDYEPADAEELSDELDDPVVVEREELESMAESAEKADDVEEELSQLSEKLDEQSDAEEVVDELSDDEISMVTDSDDFEVVEAGKVEMVDEVSDIYAEELEKYSPFTAEDLSDRFSPIELRDRIDDHEEAELSTSIEDTEPEPEGGDADEDELSDTEDEVDEEAQLEAAREEFAEELEDRGWDAQAEKVRSGEISITQE